MPAARHRARGGSKRGARRAASQPAGRQAAQGARPPIIRRARAGDLDGLAELERLCFQPWRRASRRSLARSLRSAHQSVWVVDGPATGPASGAGQTRDRPRALAAALVLWHFPQRVRVYDVATHPDARGQGLGRALMAHAERLARKQGCAWVTLEADPTEPGLVPWYEHQGYAVASRRKDFYGPGRDAVRMRKAA